MSFLHGRWKMLSSQRQEAHWTQSEREQQDLSFTFNIIWHFSYAVQTKQTTNRIVPVGRSVLSQSRLSERGRTSACSPGRSWARHGLSLRSGHSRTDLCLHRTISTIRNNACYLTCFLSLNLNYLKLLTNRDTNEKNKYTTCRSVLKCYYLQKCLAKSLTLQKFPRGFYALHRFSCSKHKVLKWKLVLSGFTLPSCSPSMFWLASTKSQNFSWLSSARNSLWERKKKVAVLWAVLLFIHDTLTACKLLQLHLDKP